VLVKNSILVLIISVDGKKVVQEKQGQEEKLIINFYNKMLNNSLKNL
jgi:hypothetical protein